MLFRSRFDWDELKFFAGLGRQHAHLEIAAAPEVGLARSRTLGRAWMTACLITWLALAVTLFV